ncbi:hypothetical protein AWC05_07675 [Mycobacterium florentinum]|uniref:Uncharacterized protein n=2 Tax=Mycobacterium florentinum TaxID=292462 RepID=A0A1X1TVH9_MYCFL|nr:hypothetical protein AWC05_07675 [Mycobacterium florentinum]
MRRLRVFGVATIVVLVVACSHERPLVPPTPTGATPLGGPSMEATPPPPPGWKLEPVIPKTQQQAQDTVIGYLKKTLAALGAGITLDASRYSGGGTVHPCKDVETGTPPMEFATNGDLTLPAGVDANTIVAKAGDIWKSWGWQVYERDGFYKPNRFGYAPDGYILQIIARYQPGYAPTLQAISPCFPADLPAERSPFPTILTG